MLIDRVEAISRPANTRAAEAAMVIITAPAGDGPLLSPTPTCQRCAVLKNLACSGKLLKNTWGGGSRRASEMPSAHSNSHNAQNRPTESSVKPTREATRPAQAGAADRGLAGASIVSICLSRAAAGCGTAVMRHAALYLSLS